MKRLLTSFLIVLLGLIVVLVVTMVMAALPPDSVPASAPKVVFSAQRAMGDLEVVAREPHPK